MDFAQCAQCGREIESTGIQFRGRIFCSDECCEDFEKALVDSSEPGSDELDADEMEADELDVVDDANLDYEDDGTPAKKKYDDDDFAITPDDF